MTLGQKAIENIVGKEENACNQHYFFFFIQFSYLPEMYHIISSTLTLYHTITTLNKSEKESF